MQVLKYLSLAVAITWQSSASADGFPTRQDVEARIPDQICYDLAFRITRFEDLHQYPIQRVPMCYSIGGVFDVAAIGPCFSNTPSEYRTCHVPLRTGTNFVTFATSKYSFHAKFLRVDNPSDSITYVRGDSSLLWLHVKPWIGANWDLRLSQILYAHRDELPVNLASVVLPPVSTTLGELPFDVHLEWRDSTSAASSTAEGSPIGRIFGVGYDEAGATYDIDISAELKSVSFLPHRR